MEKVVIENTRATSLTLPGGKRIGPGKSELTLDEFKALEALDPSKGPGKVWSQWRKQNYVRVTVTSAPDAAKPGDPPKLGVAPPASLADRSDAAADAMVATETDVDTLRAWHSADSRPAIRKAIDERISSINEGTAKTPTPRRR